jgi:protocatechuate 3,4-dioxygenase beta subunit
LIVLTTTLLTLTLSAQEIDEPRGTVRGVITDASGAPVAQAIVEVYASRQLGLYSGSSGSNPHSAISDSDGRFELRHIPPDEPQQFVALADGFAPALLTLPPLKPGQVIERNVTLKPGGSLTARILDDEHRPFKDLVVHLFLDPPRVHLLGDQEPGRAFSARTDATGNVRFDALPPGRFTLVARPAGFYQAIVVSPELSDSDQATTVDLDTIVLERAARLTGRVVDDQGRPVSGAELTLRNQNSPTRFTSDPARHADARTDHDGHFEVATHTRNPIVDLIVEHPAHPRFEAGGFMASAGSPVEIVLAHGVTLRGKVVDPEGGPVVGASVRLGFEPTAQEGMSPGPARDSRARSGAGGQFAFSGLARGVARLYATDEGRAPSEVAVVEIDEDAPPAVTLTLQQGSALVGRVDWSDGRPAARAVLSLSSKDPAYQIGGLEQSGSLTKTEDDGSFRIDGLAPGRYDMIVFDPEHSSSVLALEEKEIVIEAGENVLNVVAPKRALVSGLVVDQRGRPVPQAQMELHGKATKAPHWSIESLGREDGSFVFPSIPQGTYQITGWSEGFGESSSAAFEVGEENVTTVVVRLGAGGSVAGRIFGLSPSDLAKVKVEAYGSGSDRGYGEVSADGAFQMTSLVPGSWRILARIDQGQLQRRAEGYVTIRAHQEARLDLEFPPTVRLMGRVLLDGEPIEGIEVQLSAGPYITTLTEKEGIFAFDSLQPRQYTLTLNAEGRAISHREVLVEADSRLELKVATGSLSGAVVDERGAPVVGAAIRAMRRGTGLWLPWNQPRTDAGGQFKVRYVEAGPYEIFVEADGYESVSRRCHTSRKEGCRGLAFTLRKNQ